MKGLAWVAVIGFKEVGQRLASRKGDPGQQDVARQRQVECGLGSAMAVPVFLPRAGVAFVVVAVFHRPVFAHGPGGAGLFSPTCRAGRRAPRAARPVAGLHQRRPSFPSAPV